MAKERKPNAALRYERENRGWSQQLLAEKLQTTDKVVSDKKQILEIEGVRSHREFVHNGR